MARKSRKTLNTLQAGESAAQNSSVVVKKENALPTGGYIRLSVENNGGETDGSIKTQIELVESYIREHEDLYLADLYVDNGYTGTNFERPEFVRMMEDVRSGKIQCIVVKDLSRFGRDYLETGYYIETIFPLLNVRFIAITDQFDSIRPEDLNSLTTPIKNMVNDMYAKDASRKMESYVEMCQKTGRFTQSSVPYGYVYSKETGKMTKDKEIEPYVYMIFTWGLSGVSREEIARRLELIGAQTPGININWKRGHRWTPITIKNILYNPAYAGFHVMGKTKKSIYRGIKAHWTDRDEWLYFPDFHEPYITMADYEKMEAIIDANQKRYDKQMEVWENRTEKIPDVFHGLVYCGGCGKKMKSDRGSHNKERKGMSYMSYHCRNPKVTGCVYRRYQQNYLKVVVMDQIKALLQSACDKNEVLRIAKIKYQAPGKPTPIERNINRLASNVAELDNKLLRAYTDYADHLLDADEYRAIKRKLTEKKQDTEKRKQEFEQKLSTLKVALQRYQEMTQRLQQFVENPVFDEEVIKGLISKIIVYDYDRIEIVFACDDVFHNALVDEFLASVEQEGVAAR